MFNIENINVSFNDNVITKLVSLSYIQFVCDENIQLMDICNNKIKFVNVNNDNDYLFAEWVREDKINKLVENIKV